MFAPVAVVWAALRRSPGAGRWVSAFLTFLWAWTGVAYHWAFFASINPAPWAFGAVSLLGAAALAWCGVRSRAIRFDPRSGAKAVLGWGLVAFALAVYPAIGMLAGHHYPASPTFGLPCPTTLFTIGTLLLTMPDTPRRAYLVPVLWTPVGSTAAVLLGVWQDLGLIVAGAAGVWAMARHDSGPAMGPRADH